MNTVGSEQSEPAVMMVAVVPGEELPAEGAGNVALFMSNVSFDRLKERFLDALKYRARKF